jgi:hypothetical protein
MVTCHSGILSGVWYKKQLLCSSSKNYLHLLVNWVHSKTFDLFNCWSGEQLHRWSTHLTAQTTQDPVLIICTPITILEQNGWQRKPAGHVVATLCKLNHATTPLCSAANSDSQLVSTHCCLQNPIDATWKLLIILAQLVEVPPCSAFNMKALSTFHTSSTAEYLLHEVLTMNLPKHYGDQSRTLTESS